VHENGVPRKIFGPKVEEATGVWGKRLHNEELHNLYSSLNINNIIISMRGRQMGTGEKYLHCLIDFVILGGLEVSLPLDP
jgi:hypothetical protein